MVCELLSSGPTTRLSRDRANHSGCDMHQLQPPSTIPLPRHPTPPSKVELMSQAMVFLPEVRWTWIFGDRAVNPGVRWMMMQEHAAHFTPDYFTVTVSLDEEVRLVMNPGSSETGSLVWTLNHEDGGQTDLSSSVSGDALYISRAKKADHAGIHHYYYSDDPDKGGLVKLIVRACLDNLWGPDCQYTCPTCYNGGVCDDVSGRCVCPPGFSGDHCQIAFLSANSKLASSAKSEYENYKVSAPHGTRPGALRTPDRPRQGTFREPSIHLLIGRNP
eukprot:XP_011674274.1 PREDICTED: uncharacterized protein LOC100890278 [Strongylocentrotus purpuratus]